MCRSTHLESVVTSPPPAGLDGQTVGGVAALSARRGEPLLRPSRCQRDRGQAAIVLVAVVAVLTVVFTVAAASMGRAVLDRTRAQSAADAAALVAVTHGPAAAARIAVAHDAVLVEWRAGPGEHEVTVVVRLGEATATARASDAP